MLQALMKLISVSEIVVTKDTKVKEKSSCLKRGESAA